MHEHITSLLIVVALSFFIPILLHRFKLTIIPVVVAEILAGIITGPSGFNIITKDPYLELLSLLGLIFLMFLSGVEIDFSLFFKKDSRQKNNYKYNPLYLAIALFSGIFITSYLLSLFLYKMQVIQETFVMTIIIATVSLGVVVPVLKDRHATETQLGQTILMTAVLCDFVTMIILSIYIALLSESASKSVMLFSVFIVAAILFYLARHFAKNEAYHRLKKGTVHLSTRSVFTLILFLVVLSESVGGENILGAFLAGVIVSLLSPRKEFLHQLESFGYGFLIPIFFVMVGVSIDLRPLIANPWLILQILLLLAALFISKIIPSLILKKWHSWKETIGAGSLLTSTLSLVIAAATIAVNLGLMSSELKNSLILVAILSSFIAPIVFNKFYPHNEQKKRSVSIIGANEITLAVAQQLEKENFEVAVYSDNEDTSGLQTSFNVTYLPSLDYNELIIAKALSSNVVVAATTNENHNITLAHYALEEGVSNIIAQVENPKQQEELANAGITPFSVLYSSWTLMKSMIEYPNLLKVFSHPDDMIYEIIVNNHEYDNFPLYELPCLGDSLILRIYREDETIVPRPDTRIQLGDRLIVSSSMDSRQLMEEELEMIMQSP